jgi:hypothetical protein
VDALPWGEDERVPAGVETVVIAEEVAPRRGYKVQEIQIKREDSEVDVHQVSEIHMEGAIQQEPAEAETVIDEPD